MKKYQYATMHERAWERLSVKTKREIIQYEMIIETEENIYSFGCIGHYWVIFKFNLNTDLNTKTIYDKWF